MLIVRGVIVFEHLVDNDVPVKRRLSMLNDPAKFVRLWAVRIYSGERTDSRAQGKKVSEYNSLRK